MIVCNEKKAGIHCVVAGVKRSQNCSKNQLCPFSSDTSASFSDKGLLSRYLKGLCGLREASAWSALTEEDVGGMPANAKMGIVVTESVLSQGLMPFAS